MARVQPVERYILQASRIHYKEKITKSLPLYWQIRSLLPTMLSRYIYTGVSKTKRTTLFSPTTSKLPAVAVPIPDAKPRAAPAPGNRSEVSFEVSSRPRTRDQLIA